MFVVVVVVVHLLCGALVDSFSLLLSGMQQSAVVHGSGVVNRTGNLGRHGVTCDLMF